MTAFLRAAGVVATLAGMAAAASAQEGHAGHGGGAPDTAASTAGYADANERMHRGMAFEFTGDADVDFARSMIPHHQGAIDMAEVVLEHGSDPEIRRLAQEIIAAQEAEIALLLAWLAAHAR